MALPNNSKRKVFDGRYEVVSIVGRGSDSVVYHARHAGSPTQEVALKVLLSQKDKSNLAERLRKEALTLVSCRHRYVVRLDDFHSIGDLCYLSMEYASFGDLRKFVNSRKAPLTPELGERFLRQSLEALDFVHATGVLHRDVKPDNILVINEREIRLADFGLALLPGEEARIEDLQSGVGSLGYLPPEVLEGVQFDQRSDQYALGLCFYEMLSGKHPFEGAPLADQLEVRRDGSFPELLSIAPQVSPHLNNVVMKMLRFSPSDRYASTLNALKAINDPDYTEVIPKKALETPATSLHKEDPFGLGEQVHFDDDDDDDLDPFAVVDTAEEEKIAPARNESSATTQEIAIANSDTPDPSISPVPTGARSAALASDTESNAALSVSEPIAKQDSEESVVIEPSTVDSEERVPQPTEKIDLERIKDIIAKDAEQKAAAAKRRSTQSHSLSKVRDAAGKSTSIGGKIRTSDGGATTTSKVGAASPFISSAVDAFYRVPHALRPVVVGLGAAVATIVVVSIAQLFSGSVDEAVVESPSISSESQSPSTQEESGTDPAASPIDASGTQLPEGTQFPVIPGGLYAGNIVGVLPGAGAPFTLISLPKQGMIAVILGIEGWSPTLVPSTNQAGEPIQPLVVRSNGMILNITGTVTSGIIEGTFANAVTGETGTWQVKKVS